jgi:S1-C subfamily serine protease
MRLFRLAGLVAAAAAMLTPASALAITGGAPDGNGHPAVGLLVADVPGAGLTPVCSGTLIAPAVFLTAGHCTAPLVGAGVTRAYVTFDPQPDLLAAPLLPAAAWTTDPLFGHDKADPHDLGVVQLAAPAAAAPLALPRAGSLDALRTGQPFANVGYGYSDRVTGGGPATFTGGGVRRVSTSPLAAETKAFVKTSNGDAGVCYGDSGGPRLLGDTNVVAAITSAGDTACAGMSTGYRLDTASARGFLGGFVPLP